MGFEKGPERNFLQFESRWPLTATSNRVIVSAKKRDEIKRLTRHLWDDLLAHRTRSETFHES